MTASLTEFVRIGFVNMLAFRLRYYTGIITYFINVSVNYFIWSAVFDQVPGFGGFDFPQMMTYVAIGWIIRSLYFSTLDVDLANDILEGKIVMSLLRPIGVQESYISRSLGESIFRLVMLTLPNAVVISVLFPVLPPASTFHFLAFLLSLAGSVLLVASINFIVGACAVHLKSILGLMRAKFWMQELLSGLLVPVALFPSPFIELSHWLPFEHIGYTPVVIYLGKDSWPSIAASLVREWVWIVLVLAIGRWFWNRLTRRMTVHGG
jgi:ABC-2 type transport system permease protein